MKEQGVREGRHLVATPPQSQGDAIPYPRDTPSSWPRGVSRGQSPPLRASCPLQYEAVMDRVQKSKLSLYKKTMEVGARLLGFEGGRQGVGPRRPGMGIWDRDALRSLPSYMYSGLSQDQG